MDQSRCVNVCENWHPGSHGPCGICKVCRKGTVFAGGGDGPMQDFATGARRSSDANKPDFEGFLDPEVLEAYAAYMHENRKTPDGKLRDSDNWQKGIPKDKYMKSLIRHVMQVWRLHRGQDVRDYDRPEQKVTLREALCGVLFNTMGYLHELLKEQAKPGIVERMATQWTAP